MLNLTPHAININGTVYEPSGTIARVEMEEEVLPIVLPCGTPIISRKSGKVTGLPESGYFLVSSMVLDALDSSYSGVAFAPDTGSTALRNDKGHIIMVTRVVTK